MSDTAAATPTTKGTKTTKTAKTGDAKRTSKSDKAGLVFPVARVHKALSQGRYAAQVGAGASVYLTAMLEYLAAELIQTSGQHALDSGKKRITPRHIMIAVRSDAEVAQLLRNVTISAGGVMPHIHASLLPIKKGAVPVHPKKIRKAKKSTAGKKPAKTTKAH